MKKYRLQRGPPRRRLKRGSARNPGWREDQQDAGRPISAGLALISGSLELSSGKGMAQRIYPGIRRIGASA